MARFGAKRRKVFKVRTQAFGGKRGFRVGLVIPGVRRARRKSFSRKAVVPVDKPVVI